MSYCIVCFVMSGVRFFFFKQKTAYEMRISDWSSDVCSSDLVENAVHDAFSLWLNQHVEHGERIAQLAFERAAARLKTEKQIVRKRIVQGPAQIGRASCRERVCQYV